MLPFLKKIFVDILPSIVATIVGAYIVHHYVIPAATPKPDAAAAVAPTEAKATPDVAAPVEKPSFVKGVAEKAAIEKTAEKASEKSGEAAPDSKKRHTAGRTKNSPEKPAAEQTASIPESPAVEERRDANGLARAAIDRLRPAAEPIRPVETPRTVAVAPAQTTLPPLAPAVTVAPPSAEVFNSGTGAIIAPVRPTAPTRSAEAFRPEPPASIPAPPPLELHDDIATTTTGRAAAVADDVVSAAKSVIHAVLPIK